jgi:hypothetical protein
MLEDAEDEALLFSVTSLQIITPNHLTFLAVDKTSLNKPRTKSIHCFARSCFYDIF